MQLKLTPAPVLGLAALATLTLCAAHPAAASVSEYTGGTVDNPLDGLAGYATTTLDFTGTAPDGGLTNQGTSFTDGAVTFTTDTGNAISTISPSVFSGSGYDYGTGDVLGAYTQSGSLPSAPITAALPANTYAVGFDFGDFAGDTFTFTTTDANGGTTPFTATGGQAGAPGTFAYIGFVSTTPLTSITFSGDTSGYGAVFDNFTYAVAPEPSTWAAFAFTGLAAMGLMLKAKRRRPA